MKRVVSFNGQDLNPAPIILTDIPDRPYRALRIRKRPNYKRRAFWIIILLLAIGYAYMVGSWWIEGNKMYKGGSDNADVKTSN